MNERQRKKIQIKKVYTMPLLADNITSASIIYVYIFPMLIPRLRTQSLFVLTNWSTPDEALKMDAFVIFAVWCSVGFYASDNYFLDKARVLMLRLGILKVAKRGVTHYVPCWSLCMTSTKGLQQ
jgi:hypothetical protein